MVKNPSIEDLTIKDEYQLLHKLHYDSIISFVFENIKKKTLGSAVYFINLIILLFLILITSKQAFSIDTISLKPYILAICSGFILGSFIIIPFHELFHALAYRIVGAKKPKFGMDLKQLIFYVTADRFVVNSKEFHWVALTPFLIINISVASAFFFLNTNWQIISLFFLFFHNIMCIGDFALLSFFHSHPKEKLFTFDILEEKTSYIYSFKEK